MPRLVRRAPLWQRIQAYTDPLDWFIYISEELNSSDWDQFASNYALYLGFAANVVFVVAQANSAASAASDDDGVFSDVKGLGLLPWLANILVLVLSCICFGNAWLVWAKTRHYRLFQQNVELAPQTPSAKRVCIESSPAGNSPMEYMRKLVVKSSIRRAHPDETRDVWEIAVWDPNPLCLQFFCLFSPLHVLVYYFNVPVPPLDPRPSIRITTTVIIGMFLSLHMWWLRASFTQQAKDNAIISRQVLNEYDSKFVHPSLVPKPCRDVAIQTISNRPYKDSSVGVRGSSDGLASEVSTYTPKTLINRTYRIHPNVNYANQYDPDNACSSSAARLTQHTPRNQSATSATTGADFSSPIRPVHTPNVFHQAPAISRHGRGDGGYLGVNTHAASPLRKSASANFVREGDFSQSASRGRESLGYALGGAGERRVSSPSKRDRDGSPLKRASTYGQDGLVGERLFSQTDGSGKSSTYGGLGVRRRESKRM